MSNFIHQYKFLILILLSFLFAIAFVTGLNGIDQTTSSDKYCMSCHMHTHTENSWLQASHHNNKSGVVVHCVDCHLPPKNQSDYWPEKIKAGSRDLYSYYFKDIDEINWDEKSLLEHAKKHVFNESCINCHANLFPLHLSKEGDKAHLYYKHNKDKLDCINCHLNVGHGGEQTHKANYSFSKSETNKQIFTEATSIQEFSNFNEQIPNTTVSFDMIAIPESKAQNITAFFIGKLEVTWDEYKAFLRETESEGRLVNENQGIDAITGATPPFGDPSQAWGMGKRPAITMTWHAANTYCKWLSQKTGKNYRFPTAKEWEYASGTSENDDFFFGGNASDYKDKNFILNLFKKPSEKINNYVIWKKNSIGKTGLPEEVLPNKFGIVNMLGNVREFCQDTIKVNNKLEYILKGGSFKSTINELLLSHKDHTQHDVWMISDPQIPKSIWWYSDCNDVGFRIVCEWSPMNSNSSIK